MKKTALLLMAVLTACVLSGCSLLVFKTYETDKKLDAETKLMEDILDEEIKQEEKLTEVNSGITYDVVTAKKAFAEALENMINNRVLPDGTPVETFGENDSLENNEFAVFDVDADGREELVIRFTDTYSAAMFEHVYSYDSESGSLLRELAEYPLVSYYDNGTLSVGISHNQGWAGRFWPYTAYKHNPETDIYEEVMFVDAWDGEIFEEDFPEMADADGDLLVYFMNPDYENGYYSNPVDGDVYESWKNEFFGEEIKIPYVNLTMENIGQIE